MDLIPLEKMFFISLTVLTKGFIIFGGSLAYVFQYKEIYERKDASGFSLFVCLTLLIANILRIMFWLVRKEFFNFIFHIFNQLIRFLELSST